MRAVLCIVVAWMFGRHVYHKTLYALLRTLTGDRRAWYQCLDALMSCAQPGSKLSLSRTSSYRAMLVCRIDAREGCVWAMPLEAAPRRPMSHCGIDVYRQAHDRCHRPAIELVKIRLWAAFRAHLVTQWVPPVWDAGVRSTFSHVLVSDMDFPTLEGWYRNEGATTSLLNKHGILLHATAEVVCLPWALCNQSLKILRSAIGDGDGDGDGDGALPYFVEEVLQEAFLPGACLATGQREGSNVGAKPETVQRSRKATKKRPRPTPQERRDAEEKKRRAERRERLKHEACGTTAFNEADIQSTTCTSSVGRQRICVYNSRDAPVRLPYDEPLLWAAVGMHHRTERMRQVGSGQVVVMDPVQLGREIQVVAHPALECSASAVRPICDLYSANPVASMQESDPKAGPPPADIPRYRVFVYGDRVYTIDMYFPTLRRYRIRTEEGGAVLAHRLLVDRWFLPFITYEQALAAAAQAPDKQRGHVREEVACYRWAAFDPSVEPADVVLERGAVA